MDTMVIKDAKLLRLLRLLHGTCCLGSIWHFPSCLYISSIEGWWCIQSYKANVTMTTVWGCWSGTNSRFGDFIKNLTAPESRVCSWSTAPHSTGCVSRSYTRIRRVEILHYSIHWWVFSTPPNLVYDLLTHPVQSIRSFLTTYLMYTFSVIFMAGPALMLLSTSTSEYNVQEWLVETSLENPIHEGVLSCLEQIMLQIELSRSSSSRKITLGISVVFTL